MEHILKYIEEATQPSGRYYDFYMKNFRELVKLIPVVGSFVDAHTLGAIVDNNLKQRLENLENACQKALKESNESLIATEIANINGIFAVIFLTNLQDLQEQANRSLDEITKSIRRFSDESLKFSHNQNFKFITISGASATGKDCLLDYVSHYRDKTNRKIEMLRKFTTREPRVVDAKYYDFVTEGGFDLIQKSGNVLFPYYKRGFRYGFDRTHFYELAREDCFAFCVFTNFRTFASDKQHLSESGVNHFAILLEASQECLMIRSEARLLKRVDLQKRKKSITDDLEFLQENINFVSENFDLRINNSDKFSKEESYNKLVNGIGLKEMALDLEELS
jgi:guanylate kinase